MAVMTKDDVKPLSFFAAEIKENPVWQKIINELLQEKLESLEVEEKQLAYGTPEHQEKHLIRRGFKDGVLWVNRKIENTAKGNKK